MITFFLGGGVIHTCGVWSDWFLEQIKLDHGLPKLFVNELTLNEAADGNFVEAVLICTLYKPCQCCNYKLISNELFVFILLL